LSTKIIVQFYRSLLGDLDELKKIDGYDSWRVHESKALSDLVQRRLEYLQNPEDCSKARKLVCRLNKVGIHVCINLIKIFY